MTEKQKCEQGLLYNANYDAELINERAVAKILCDEFNRTAYADENKRNELIRRIVGKAGERFVIEPTFWCDYGYNIHLGENFYSNHNLVILDGAKVVFGDNVFIGPNCGFYTASHPAEVVQRNEGLEYALPINIGNNVWFGGNVTVLPGVAVGDNSVIGAGSIVNKNIPANVIAVGNPCRVVKQV